MRVRELGTHREDGPEEGDALRLREPGEEDAERQHAAVQAEEVDRALLRNQQRHVVVWGDHRHRRQRRAATRDGATARQATGRGLHDLPARHQLARVRRRGGHHEGEHEDAHRVGELVGLRFRRSDPG